MTRFGRLSAALAAAVLIPLDVISQLNKDLRTALRHSR